MNKLRRFCKFTLLVGCFWVTCSQAGQLEMTFTEPDSFTDIRSGFNSPRYSAEDIAANLEKYLTKLAQRLPDDYKLIINFTDIDLAGDALGYDIRVVTERYPPRLAFFYQLLDENSQVILESNDNIRDFAFMSNRSLKHKNSTLGFEKKLLDDWFKNTFKELVKKDN